MNDSDKPDGAPVTVEELIALREGDLSEEQVSALTARIDRDPRARELLVELAQTDQVLDRVRNQPVPPDLAESIDALIAREQARRAAGESEQEQEQEQGSSGDGDRGEQDPGDDAASGGAGSTGSP